MIWADILKVGVDHGTRNGLLTSVEKLYRFVAEKYNGQDRLDSIIAAADFSAIEDALTGYLVSLRNESASEAVNRQQTWQTAVQFLRDILEYAGVRYSPLSRPKPHRIKIEAG